MKKEPETSKIAKKEEKTSKIAKKKVEVKMTDVKKKLRKKDYAFAVGKRKRAVARAVVRAGSGVILINGKPLENINNEVLRLRIKEPFIVSETDWGKYDFSVNVKGGGMMGQADAARMSIARVMVEISGPALRQKFLDYDRNLLVYDPRRTEPHKPPRSSQGPRRYKQRSKR